MDSAAEPEDPGNESSPHSPPNPGGRNWAGGRHRPVDDEVSPIDVTLEIGQVRMVRGEVTFNDLRWRWRLHGVEPSNDDDEDQAPGDDSR